MKANTAIKVATLKKQTERVRLTDSFVNKLIVRSREYTVRDLEVMELYVRVQPSGSIAYYIQKNQRKKKIDNVGSITVVQARKSAREYLVNGFDYLEQQIASKLTLADAVEEYFATNNKLSTGYKSNMNSMLRVFSKHSSKPISSLSVDSVINTVKTSSGYSDATLTTAINCLSVISSYAIAKGVMDSSPTKNIRALGLRFSPNVRSNKLSSQDDFDKFFNVLLTAPSGSGISPRNTKDHKITADLALFILLTGCRSIEALNLKRSDCWFDESDGAKKGSASLRTLTFYNTKNGRDLSLQITPLINALIARNLDSDNKDDYIFRSRDIKGNQIAREAMYGRLERLLKKAPINPHDLRRTFSYHASLVMDTRSVDVLTNHIKQADMSERYIGEKVDITFDLLMKYQMEIQKYIWKDDLEYDGYSPSRNDSVRIYSFEKFIWYSRLEDDSQIKLLADIREEERVEEGGLEDLYGI